MMRNNRWIFLIAVFILFFMGLRTTPTNSFLSADSSIRYEEINRQKQNCRGSTDFSALGGVPSEQTAVFLSPVYKIKQKYKSMKGPGRTQKVFLLKDQSAPPQLLWITGYEAVVVKEDGQTPELQEFMCHSNLDLDVKCHAERFGAATSLTGIRLFTLSQGQVNIRFPKGFGIPILSDEQLDLTTQVLNNNLENPDLRVRYQIRVHFIADQDLKEPLTPLFETAAHGLVLLEPGKDPYFGIPHPDRGQHGSGCLVGATANVNNEYKDQMGRRFSGHWVVKPGREINKTLVTEIMRLRYDTRIHYIAVHLHPFAESLELRDLTAGKRVFKSRARNFKNGIGLDAVDFLSSRAGIPVYKDHQYELISVYNNTSQEDQDSMAVMYFYLEDKNFRKENIKKPTPFPEG